MEQHHNYSETFGFINALSGHEDNFARIQSQEADEVSDCSKDLMQGFLSTTLQNNDFSTSSPPPPITATSSATAVSSDYVQYQDISSSSQVAINQKSNDSFDIQSDPILESQSNQNTNIQEKNNGEADKKLLSLDSTSTTTRKDGKKRKRIVLLNDDEDSDGSSELKREILDKSIDEESKELDQKANEIETSVSACGGDEADVESEENDDESTAIVNPDALKARFLLKSAIIIPDPDKKKKKKPRVLVSDDEEQPQQIETSIDDIGLVIEGDNEVENEQVSEDIAGDIIIFNEPTYETTQKPEGTINDNQIAQAEEIHKDSEVNDSDIPFEITNEKSPSVPINDKKEEDKSETIETGEKSKKEENIDEVLERIKPMADDDDFFKYEKSSEDDDNQVDNEKYFGTPDKSVVANAPKKRGPKPGSKRKPSTDVPKVRQKRGDRYEKDFVDDSASSDSESSDYSDSLTSSESSSSESSVEEVSRTPQRPKFVVKKPIPPPTITLAKVPTPRDLAKKDRFYDQSRNIPDSVYFGDVKVPLHVLHTKWNSSVEDKKINNKNQPIFNSYPPKRSVITIQKKTPQYVESLEDPKLSTLKDLVRITGIKINYSKLFDGVKSTDHKCMIIKRILAQKGLSGEPTVAKCKKLKRDLQAKRESAELDKSLIITEEGRTRRSRRNLPQAKYNDGYSSTDQYASSKSLGKPEQTVQPKLLETLSKIKSVIDSDSE